MKTSILLLQCLVLFVGLPRASAQSDQANASTPPADAEDTKKEIQQIETMLPNIPDRGAALFLIAHDYAHLGNAAEAWSFLKQCMALDEGFDPEGDVAFAPLRDNREFRDLIERVHARYPPVHQGHLVFTVRQKDLIPEGLAINRKTGILYMGSLNRRKIVKISRTGAVTDLIHAGQYSIGPICGLKVEEADGSVWANTCSDDGVGAELLHFDRTGGLTGRFPPPTPGAHLFNDLVLDGREEIFLTDSLANRVYRFDRRKQRFSELTLVRAIYYPNGIALSDDGHMLYIADAFGVVVVDLRNKNSREIEGGGPTTLSGADGLYWHRNSLVAVQNSLGSARIAQFLLAPDGLKVTAVIPLEYKSSLVTLPTTGAVEGDKLYFMSNTQVDNFKNNQVVDPAKLEPIRISVLELPH
jgi:sugar lactone lactonase YvrE